MAFCERQQKQFAIRKPLFEKTFYAQCTSASVERVFNNGAINLLGYTDASKAQCIDRGKLFHSLAINQKANCLRVEMSSRKMPQRYLHTVHEESGIPSTRTTCKTRIWHVPAKHANRMDARAHSSTLAECAPKKIVNRRLDLRGL